MRLKSLLAATALVLAAATAALADGAVDKIMTASDKARLANYGATRKEALAEANKGGDPKDLKVLNQVIAKPPASFQKFDMTGNWQCRTIKVGGLLPLVVYGWFKCRVTDDGSGWMLEKVSGSQRTKGRFYTEGDKRLIYLGSGYVDGDPVKPYGAGKETDQVGYAFLMGPKSWRIEFPAPYYESKLDILEFKR